MALEDGTLSHLVPQSSGFLLFCRLAFLWVLHWARREGHGPPCEWLTPFLFQYIYVIRHTGRTSVFVSKMASAWTVWGCIWPWLPRAVKLTIVSTGCCRLLSVESLTAQPSWTSVESGISYVAPTNSEFLLWIRSQISPAPCQIHFPARQPWSSLLPHTQMFKCSPLPIKLSNGSHCPLLCPGSVLSGD